MRNARVIAVASLLAATLAAGCTATVATGAAGDPAAPKATGAAALVADRCTRCHGLERIKSASHDAAGWATTVHRMRTQHGAQLSDAEEQQVAGFLGGGGAKQL